MHPLAELDDIGFIGIAAGRELSEEDIAIFAQKGEEARQRYYATHSKEHIESVDRKARAFLAANDRANAQAAAARLAQQRQRVAAYAAPQQAAYA